MVGGWMQIVYHGRLDRTGSSIDPLEGVMTIKDFKKLRLRIKPFRITQELNTSLGVTQPTLRILNIIWFKRQ